MDIIKTSNSVTGQTLAKHLRLKTRIKESIDDNTYYVDTHDPDTLGLPKWLMLQGPKLYAVKVQVKVFGFWLTVWAETCDFSDGDTRPYIKNCAEEVHQALTDNV
ncbi:MAG: hypothetical protein NC403_08775 [Muribaculaceae bacterium]|nr:hypothetical protein [Muribaculaceae bacterium]